MSSEIQIHESIVKKFPFLAEKAMVKRARRISVEVSYDQFRKVFDYVVNDCRCPLLCAITGFDEGEQFGIMYHLAHNDGTIVNLKTFVPRANPVFDTITDRFPSADLYERELVDLFGMVARGLKEGKRYPLPDSWPAGQYPLRKDWKTPAPKEEAKDHA